MQRGDGETGRRGDASICTGDGEVVSFGHCGGNIRNMMSPILSWIFLKAPAILKKLSTCREY